MDGHDRRNDPDRIQQGTTHGQRLVLGPLFGLDLVDESAAKKDHGGGDQTFTDDQSSSCASQSDQRRRKRFGLRGSMTVNTNPRGSEVQSPAHGTNSHCRRFVANNAKQLRTDGCPQHLHDDHVNLILARMKFNRCSADKSSKHPGWSTSRISQTRIGCALSCTGSIWQQG